MEQLASKDKTRLLILNRILAVPYLGFTLREWFQLLQRHNFAVDVSYLPRALTMTVNSITNTAFAAYEERLYGKKVSQVTIQPPVFILGHWRSGTTFLHNILSKDPQFYYPGPWQSLNPRTFLTSSQYAKMLRWVKPKNRMLDNISVNGRLPFEDELATCRTLASPYLQWAFPRSHYDYNQYITFRNVPDQTVEEWKAALVFFYKKLTWKYNRPLLLKSPPHTGRIKILLELFPDARFIHIHRNPYEVFRSTKRANVIMANLSQFQKPHAPESDTCILERYRHMYDVFFEERQLVPRQQFCDIQYEDLEQNPMTQVQQMYEQLNLPGFHNAKQPIQQYIDSLGTYSKNRYPEMPPVLRQNIAEAWRRSFEIWGYAY